MNLCVRYRPIRFNSVVIKTYFKRNVYFHCRKLKLYEEQELTMQVFCEPENNQVMSGVLDRRASADLSVVSITTFVLTFF